jgi:hypothetical protein
MVPLIVLAEFAAHEEQFFTGLAIHPCQKHAEIGKFLPLVAWHFG